MTAPVEPARPVRADGEQSRERLLRAALALFAQHGYAKASIRDIAEAAQTNVAAISYYFGDKAGLYRAAFHEPMGSASDDIARYAGEELTLGQALRGFFASFIEPLREGDMARQCMKLHFREMFEPTGQWEQELQQGIVPMHNALVVVLCRHFGVAQPDVELHRLATCIAGLGVQLHVGRDVTDAVSPELNAAPEAWNVWADRLVLFAEAMIAAELSRRQQLAGAPAPRWLREVADSAVPAAGGAAAETCPASATIQRALSAIKTSLRAGSLRAARLRKT